MKRLSSVVVAVCVSLALSGTAFAQEKEVESSWTDALEINAFVDAYAAFTSHKAGVNLPGALVDGTASHRSYVFNSGFGLSFAGLDVSLTGEQFGGTISVRMGPSVIQFFGDNGGLGFDNLTQAYVTWMPFDALTLDLGQFGTIYGAEVAESWQNINYSRGALYWAMQPFWHTGLRANYAITDSIGLTGLLVNGTNNILEDNKSPSTGLQLSLAFDPVEIYVGWLGALHPSDGGENGALFDHFLDLVATVGVGNFSAVLNVDFALEDTGGAGDYMGASLALGYGFTNWFGAGLRGEYLTYLDSDCGAVATGGACPASYDDLMTATVTLDIKPIPNRGNLILRPEFRVEIASDDAFVDRDNDPANPTDIWYAAMLGAVVTTN